MPASTQTELLTCTKHHWRVASISTAGDGRNDHWPVVQCVLLALKYKWLSDLQLVCWQTIALKTNLVGEARCKVWLHITDGYSVMGPLGSRAAWHYCCQIQLYHLKPYMFHCYNLWHFVVYCIHITLSLHSVTLKRRVTWVQVKNRKILAPKVQITYWVGQCDVNDLIS